MDSKRKTCVHGNLVCEKCTDQISDEAKRFADGINGLLAFNQPWEIRNKFVAVRLSDGSVDSALYDTRDDAIRHQSNPDHYFFLPIGNFGGGINKLDAELCLQVQRKAHKAGFRVSDGPPDQITPFESGDLMLAALRAGMARRRNGS